MANVTIHQLTELAAAPATDDELGVWDTSAALMKRITYANWMANVLLSNVANTFTQALTLDTVLKLSKSTLTIASGAITVSKSMHDVDTEAGAASDDLDTINGGAEGQILIIGSLNSARDVTIKHATGNIFNATAADVVLTSSSFRKLFIYDSGGWRGVG